MKKYDTNYTPEIGEMEELPPVPDMSDGPKVEKQRRVRRPSSGNDNRRKSAASTAKTSTSVKKEPLAWTVELKKFFNSTNLRLISGVILAGLGAWLAIAFVSYLVNCVHDQASIIHSPVGQASDINNAAGEGGARISEILINNGFGLGSAVIIFWIIVIALKLLVKWPRYRTLDFTIKCLVAFITLSLIVGLSTIALDTPVNWGGYHGRYVNLFIMRMTGPGGAIVLSVVMLAIFVIICLRDVILYFMRLKRRRDARKRAEKEALEAERRRLQELEEMRRRENEDEVKAGESAADLEMNGPLPQREDLSFDENSASLYSELPDFEDEVPERGLQLRGDEYSLEDSQDNIAESDSPEAEKTLESEEQSQEDSHEEPAGTVNPETGGEDVSQSDQDSGESGSPESDDPLDRPMVVTSNIIVQAAPDQEDKSKRPGVYDWVFPSLDLLKEGPQQVAINPEEQLENKEKIRQTLKDFDVPITSIEATAGPTVTLYEIRPESGVKIAKIRNLADDMALSLSARGVRIIAPIPGKGTVGIEVANKVPQTVSMRTVLNSEAFRSTKFKLPLVFGATISNDVYIADLTKMPHMLVAGATGQGKSAGLNAIITSLLYSKRPDELKFVMVDPKMVEFSLYAKIEKHYLAKIPEAEEPIITDMSKVVATLSSLCVEMDDRYQLLKEAHVRNIEEYNAKIKAKVLNPENGHRFLPYIVVIVDEFSDLIMTSGKEVEIPIARLAQKARAVGMHVIIATQRPSANVITGIIKANFPVRTAFKVSSSIDSKTILDTSGAQQLIGRGDMLISNNSEMVRVQGAFIDTPEVEAVTGYIARQPYGGGAYILPEPLNGSGEGFDGGDENFSAGDFDPLLNEIAHYIISSNTASTSNLQRKYNIGYNRAGRIMDQLEALGVVGPASGGKPRSVLVDSATLEDILSKHF